MTLSEEFIALEDGSEAAPSYPKAFGMTLTPQIIGVMIAVAGLALSGYMLFSLLMPAWEKHQELAANQNQKQNLVAQKAASLQQSEKVQADLAQAQQQRIQVLALFANEQTLDTLLLDINRLIQSANVPQNARAKLKKFVPANQTAEIISDSSLGPDVNGKLKRRNIEIALEATFEQTQAILRNIERLQSLLIVRNYDASMAPVVNSSSNPGNSIAGGPPLINTSFQLQALIPLSPEEVAKAAEPAKDAKEQKK